ncbi:MAG TPA: SGNH/GDSL hydrolase family protein [Gemmatimonadaceae bacterium]|nr:SGNH/GDSL hydrolase family protein [Gemmatimonadaceae bacterium]
MPLLIRLFTGRPATVGVLTVALAACAGYGGGRTPASEAHRPETTDQPGSPSALAAPRFLALGDSYTIGESVPEYERWPVQLAAMLREGGVAVEAPRIIARTGWTTDELEAALDSASPVGPYELVSLLIGVNNQYRGRDAAEYRREFDRLLQRAIGYAGGRASRVVVLSIPDWGVMPFAEGRERGRIAAEIDTFNAINRELAAGAGARWVDVTGVSREAARDPSLVAGDRLHPSGAQYARWARLALPEAMRAFGR